MDLKERVPFLGKNMTGDVTKSLENFVNQFVVRHREASQPLVVQFDEDYDSRYDYPALWSVEASDE